MNPVVTIAAADAAQIALVRKLADQVWRQHYRGILSVAQIDYMLDRGYSDDALLRFVGADDAGLALARKAGAAIGFAAWYRPQQPVPKSEARVEPHGQVRQPQPERAMKLDKLYVLPAHHGAGVGRMLIEHVVAKARAAGCTSVTLNVNRQNAIAIRAYSRCGFAIRGRGDFPIGNGFLMEDFIMVRDL